MGMKLLTHQKLSNDGSDLSVGLRLALAGSVLLTRSSLDMSRDSSIHGIG